MSEIRVTNILGENGNSPVNFTQGINMSGIVTATSFVPSQGQLSNRNKVINGAMTVSQRATSFAAANNVFTLDRHKIFGSHDGAVTVTQSATSPDGFAKSLKVDVTTADTSIAAGQYIQLNHRIEAQNLQDLAFGTSAAKTITVSFYVRSNVTGNYSFAIQLPDNSNKQVSLVYTINSADTWERKTFSIAGDTSGGINDDNGNGFNIFWNLAIGTTYTSGTQRSAWHAYADADFAAGHAVNLLSSTSNEWHLTGVQVEVGPVATPFEHRTFADEITRCSRYLQIFHVPTSNSKRASNITATVHGAGNGVYLNVAFIHPMRVAPSVTVDGAFGGNVFTGGWSGDTLSSITAEYETDALSTLGFNGITSASISGSGRTVGLTGQIYTANNGSNDAALIYSAEL